MRSSVGKREDAAVILLAGAGILLPLIGWLAGVLLLWSSRAWTRGEKLLGTLLTPGMLLIPVVLILDSSSDVCVRRLGPGQEYVLRCGGGASALPGGVLLLAILLLIAVPIITAVTRRVRAGARVASGG